MALLTDECREAAIDMLSSLSGSSQYVLELSVVEGFLVFHECELDCPYDFAADSLEFTDKYDEQPLADYLADNEQVILGGGACLVGDNLGDKLSVQLVVTDAS